MGWMVFTLAGGLRRPRAHGSLWPHCAAAERLAAALSILIDVDLCWIIVPPTILEHSPGNPQRRLQALDSCSRLKTYGHKKKQWSLALGIPAHLSTPATRRQTSKTQTAADLSVVPLQVDLKALKEEKEALKEEKKETCTGQRQALEAHKQVLLQGRRHQVIQAALRQRYAKVVGLQAELRCWVSTPALAPACWSCAPEADWRSQTPPNPRSCGWQMLVPRLSVMQISSWVLSLG